MKRTWTLLLIWLIAHTASRAQCTFISPTVDIISTQTSGANCIINFNLSFDIITNSGNKVIFVHLWKLEDYPSLSYANAPTAAELSNTILNVVIDNFGTPTLMSTYSPAPSVNVQSPANNPSMTLQKTSSTTPGADRFIISNIQITTPGACASTFVFKGDAWSSNANSASPAVQCSMLGFSAGLNDPLVSGACATPVPDAAYNFNISTTSASLQVYYDVYLDNGNGVLDPANDILINSRPISAAVTITPGSPYNSGNLSYPPAYNTLFYSTRKIFVVVAAVGRSYLLSTEINPCGVTVYNFGDLPTEGSPSWPQARSTIVGTYDLTTLTLDNSVLSNTAAVWAGNKVGVLLLPFIACTNGKDPVLLCDQTDDGFGIPATPVGAGGTYPFTVTINGNLAGLTAYYGLWFDWNNDGNFANDLDGNGNPAFYSGNATTQSPRTVPVYVKIPSGFSSSYKVRLIVSGAPVTSTMYASTSIINGEVEDYFAPIHVALPLTFRDFQAQLQQCTAYLSFSTANENNNSFFRIEQSSDAINWHVIAIIYSKGKSSNDYQFTDTKPASGKNYYRIQQVDNNALYTYSKTITLDNTCDQAHISVAPNPATDVLTLDMPATIPQATISLLNASGQVMLQTSSSMEGSRTISVASLPAGIYMLQVTNGKELLYSQRVVKN